MSTFLKITFGILIGIILSISALILYRAWGLHNIIQSPVNADKVSITKDSLNQSIIQLKLTNLSFQEKFDSINKRLDDFLMFGGLIITLLLAISISVYLKTEAEVDRHMKKDFAKNKDQIDAINAEAIKTLNEIKGSLLIAQQKQKEIEAAANSVQTPINP